MLNDIWNITDKVRNSRSLLDLVAEYLLSGSIDVDPADRLETVIFAVELARDEAKKAEEALYSFKPNNAQNRI